MDMKDVVVVAGVTLAGVIVGSLVGKIPEAKKIESKVEVGPFKWHLNLEC